MSTSQVPQAVEGFLKELLAAKKAVRLYPAGNPRAEEWVQRLRRFHETALKEGLPRHLRVAHGRFEWEGGHLATRDPALEAFRFELASRQITEIVIDPGVEPWELRQLLDFLNQASPAGDAAGSPPTPVDQRRLVHITIGGSLSHYNVTGTETTMVAGLGEMDGFVAEILESLGRQFRAFTEDRQRLAAWFVELAQAEEGAGGVCRAIQMLIPIIEAEPDREVRYRTLCEALMSVPDTVLGWVVREWLLPRAQTDPDVLNLLTRFSADEFAGLTGLISSPALEALRAGFEGLPEDDWRAVRLREGLQEALVTKDAPTAALDPLIAMDDPEVVKLREKAQAAGIPSHVLAHSIAVLFRLLGEAEVEGYPALLVDALESAITEALEQGRVGLAFRALHSLSQGAQLRPEWLTEHQRRFDLLRRRLSGRSQVGLLADVLRRGEGADEVRDAAEYLRLLGQEAVEEFLGILTEEGGEASRGRMLEVLAGVGPAAVPAIRARVRDRRWAMARNMVGVLARIADPTAYQALQHAAGHENPHVRREVARALGAFGSERAVKVLLEYLHDADSEVRLAATKTLGTLMDPVVAASLREFLKPPARTISDVLVKRRIIAALMSTGSREARQVVVWVAQRRLWPWQRSERKVRQFAREAARGGAVAETAAS